METASLDRSMSEIRRSFRTLNSSIRANSNNLKFGERSVESYEKGIESLNDDIAKQRKNLDDTKRHLDEYKRSGEENTVAAQNLAREYNNQADNLNRLEHQLANATKELERMKEEQRIAESGWGRLGTSFSQMGDSLQSFGGQLRDVGGTLTKSITVPVAGVTTAVGGMVAAFGWGRLKSVDSAQAQLRGLGYEAEDVERISGQLAEALEGGMLTMGEATSAAATAMAAGVKEGDELTRYIQILDGTVAGSTGTFEEMEQIFGRIIDQGHMTRNEFDMIAQRMPGFSKAVQEHMGVSSEEMYEMLRNGEIATGEFLDIMEDFSGDMATEYAKSWDGMVQNTKAYIGILGENLLGGVFEQSKESIAEFIELLSSEKVQEWAAETGERLGEVFSNVVESVKGAIGWFVNLEGWQQKLIGSLGGLVVAAGPVLSVAGMFIGAIGKVMTVIGPLFTKIAELGGVKKALGVIIRNLASRFSFLLGPVGIAIGVITTLAGIFVTAYKNSETFRDIIHQLKDAFLNAVEGVKEFLTTSPQIQAFIDGVKEGFQTAKDLIMEAISAVVEFFQEKIEQIKSFWDSEGSAFLEAWTNFWEGIRSVVQPIIDGIVSIIQWAFPYIVDIIKGALTVALEIVKQIWSNIQGVINGALDIIMGLVKTFSGLFTGDFSKMWEGVKQIFSGAIEFIWNFIQLSFFGRIIRGVLGFARGFSGHISTMWQGIRDIFNRVISWIVNFVRNSFNSIRNTVSNILTRIRNTTQTIWNAIKNYTVNPVRDAVRTVRNRFSDLRDSALNIFSRIRDGVSDRVSSMVGYVRDMPGKMKDGLKKGVSAVKDGMVSIARGMVDGLKNGVNGVIRGINWVLDKLSVDSEISLWNPANTFAWYAQGTRGGGHPGGPAVVSDGKGSNSGPELITTPDGKSFLSPNKPTLIPDMPKGTQVVPARITKQLLDIPHYADGTGWFGRALDWGKGAVRNIIDTAVEWTGNVWDYATNPGKLLDAGLSLLDIDLPSLGIVGDIARGGFNYVKDAAVDYIKGIFDDFMESVSGPTSGGASAWRPMILRAAAQMGETVSQTEVNGIIAQIQRESGGNEKITQSSAVWDVNMAQGNPARGLLQYIPQTFAAYAVPGHNNIYSGYDQLLAFFNNRTWRRDLPYGTRGWGPRGGRKYATGGLVNEGLYHLAEEGYPEWIIPTAPNRRTDAMKLLALAAKDIQGNKRPQQLPNVSNNDNHYLEDVVDKLTQQVQLLTQLVVSSQQVATTNQVIANKPVLSEGDIKRANDKQDARQAINHSIFTGKPGGL